VQNPLRGVCKREVRIQESGVRIIEHVACERDPILNTEFWLLNTALAEPTKEVLKSPHYDKHLTSFLLASDTSGSRECFNNTVTRSRRLHNPVIERPT
jgi:hypothetical protein